MNAARECRANIFYYVAHVDYIQYIGGLKPIGEGVIFICLQLQQLLAGYEPRHHRRDGHHLSCALGRMMYLSVRFCTKFSMFYSRATYLYHTRYTCTY
jgi:hypothetical protein